MRVPPKPAPEPGEWQQEPGAFGRRYRMVGGVKEYEPEINGIPQSVFFASQKRQRELDAEARERERKEAAEREARRRNCPIYDNTGLNNTDCSLEACALYMDGCTLARFTPAKDTEGLQCPFDRYKHKCRKDCALYKGGCTLTGITTNKESEDK